MILHAELNKNLKVGGTAGSSKYTPGHTLEMPQSYWIYPAPLCQTPKNAQISNDFQSHQTIQDIWASTVLSFIFLQSFSIALSIFRLASRIHYLLSKWWAEFEKWNKPWDAWVWKLYLHGITDQVFCPSYRAIHTCDMLHMTKSIRTTLSI